MQQWIVLVFTSSLSNELNRTGIVERDINKYNENKNVTLPWVVKGSFVEAVNNRINNTWD